MDGKSRLSNSIYLEPLVIIDKGNIIMSSILAYADRMNDILQISFFESSIYNPNAFKLLLERASELARERGASKMSGSLNIHVNYGLGFLSSDYHESQSFGIKNIVRILYG